MITTFKKSISVVLAIVMVLMSVCVFSTGVAAAENTFSVTVESTASDLFPTATSTFDASTEKVTVTYWYNLPDYSMVNSEWVLTYDSNALQYDETDGVNQKTERGVVKSYVMRSTNSSYTTVNVKKDENGKEEGRIVGNCSDPGGYPVDEGRVAFISVTFKVLKPVKDSTVNLDLKVMQVRGYDWEPAAKQVDFVKEGQIINEDVDYVSNPTYSAAYSGEFDEEYAPEIKADNPADLTLSSVSISFGESILMNFYTKAELAGYTDPYVVFTCEGDVDKVTGELVDGRYKFVYNKIYPQLLTDEVTAVLYAKKDGVVYYGNSVTTSVKKYSTAVMKSCADGKTNVDITLRTLLVDLLNYGTEAQKYKNYKLNDFANKDLTEEQKSWASPEPELKSISNTNYEDATHNSLTGDAKATWKSVKVRFAETVQLMPVFATDDITNKTVKIEIKNETFTYTEKDFNKRSDGTYELIFNKLYANEMRTPVYMTIYENGKQCSNVCRYSIESYVYGVRNAGYDDDLFTAMMKYGIAAEKYISASK